MMRRLLLVALVLSPLLFLSPHPELHAQPERPDGCDVSLNEDGSFLSICSDVHDFAEFLEEFTLSVLEVRLEDDTAPLRIESVPAGASVSIDGEVFGVTPLNTVVEQGPRFVRVTAPGFEAFSQTINVPSSGAARTVTLQEAVQTSFLQLEPSTFLSLPGFQPDGDFFITDLIRDKDGAIYVSFLNRISIDVEFGGLDSGAEDGTSTPRNIIDVEPSSLDFHGVAKSVDDGASWELVFSLADSHTGTGITSPKLIDSLYASQRTGDDPDEHWVKIYYKERSVVSANIGDIMPHPDGGVIISYSRFERETREIDRVWDNLESIRDFYLFVENETPPERYLIDFDNPGRYGLSRSDIEEETTSSGGRFVISPGNFGERPVSVESVNANEEDFRYQGTVDGVHYWFAEQDRDRDYDGRSRFIWKSEDNGQNIELVGRFVRSDDDRTSPVRREDLRISPDGDLYLLDQILGTLHQVGDDEYELVSRVPDEFWITPNEIFGDEPFAPDQVMEFDDGGNIHLVLVRDDNPIGAAPAFEGAELYYQFIPKDKPDYDSIAIFTGGGACASCQQLRDFLTGAGIQFTVDPQLPSGQQATLEAIAAESGYPVVDRISGDEHLFVPLSDPIAVARATGASYPLLIDSFSKRTGGGATASAWVVLLLDGDTPTVLTERSDGIFGYTPQPGGWAATKVFDSPPSTIRRANGTVSPRAGSTPQLPGTDRFSRGRQFDIQFNKPEGLDDVRFLYPTFTEIIDRPDDDLLEDLSQSTYALIGSTVASEPENSGRDIVTVSQLIPAGTFFVRLPEDGSVSSVSGELAGYVVEQGEVELNGGRYYRVKADLRQQGETAQNGNILSRMIGGFIEVTVEGETSFTSLFLNVDNTRLTAFDAHSPLNTVDLTMEAVRFVDGRWIITNNLALTNVIRCSGTRVISIDPHTFTSVSAANEAEEQELQACLRGLETEPLNIPDCEAWEDAQLVLRGELIGTLAGSLPLTITEDGVVNYVAAFGDTNFTGHRILNVSNFAAELGCSSEINADSVVVARISGDIISETDTVFDADITIAERGSVETGLRSAPSRAVNSREIEWLEFEAAFLEEALRMVRNQSLDQDFFGASLGRATRYQLELQAVRATLHCAYSGHHIIELAQYFDRTAERPDGARPECLSDFFRSPGQYWPSMGEVRGTRGTTVDAIFPWALINAFDNNPTMAYLKAGALGTTEDYETFFIRRAQELESRGDPQDPARFLPIDLALDHYARVRNRILADSQDWETVLGNAAIVSLDPVRFDIYDGTMRRCLTQFAGEERPFEEALAATPVAANYRAGLSCVDDRFTTAEDRSKEYQLFGLGLRDPFMAQLINESGNDFDVVLENLELLETLIPRIQGQVEASGTAAIDANTFVSDDLPALERIAIIHKKMETLATSKSLFLDLLIPGTAECGAGLLAGLTSRESIYMIGTGFALAAAAPVTGGASLGLGLPIMAGAGIVLSGQGIYDLAQQWEALSAPQKFSGICQNAIGTLMSLQGVSAAKAVHINYSVSTLQASLPQRVNVNTIKRNGGGSALPLEEQLSVVRSEGGSPPLTRGPLGQLVELFRPLSSQRQQLIAGLNRSQQVEVLHLADKFDLDGISTANPDARLVFDALVETMRQNRSGDDLGAFLRLRQERGSANRITPEVQAPWRDFGGALVAELAIARGRLPRSLSVFVEQGKLVGADAPVLQTLLDAALPVLEFDPRTGGVWVPIAENLGTRRNNLLVSYLNSDRMQAHIKNPARSSSVYTPKEVNALRTFARDVMGDSFDAQARVMVDALGQPDIALLINKAIREAAEANGLNVGEASALTVGRINVEPLSRGAFKVVSKVEVEVAGNPTAIELVVKNGMITPDEIALMSDLAGDGLAARQFGGELVENLGLWNRQSTSISVEEFVPGETWSTLAREATPQQTAQNARVIGELDAKLLLGTLEQRASGLTASYNRDLHAANIKIFNDSDGNLVAKIVDYDATPEFHRFVTEEAYFYNTIQRRMQLNLGPRQYVEIVTAANFESIATSYLSGFVEAFVEAGSTRSRALDGLRQASTNLRNPTSLDRLSAPADVTVWRPLQETNGVALADFIIRFVEENSR